MPVVTNAGCDGETIAHFHLVLNERAHLLLVIDEVRVARVLSECRGEVGSIVLERCGEHGDAVGGQCGREGVSAELVGQVVEGAAAEVRGAGAPLHQVAAVRPGDDVGKAEVVLGPEGVGLRRAGKEITGQADAWTFGHILVAVGPVFADQRDLVERDGRERGIGVRNKIVFVVDGVVASSGQRLPAHALVLARPIFVAVLHVG